MTASNKINSVFIAAWYPHEKKHHFGIFIKEHANAVSLFSNVSVIYLRFFKSGIIPKILYLFFVDLNHLKLTSKGNPI